LSSHKFLVFFHKSIVNKVNLNTVHLVFLNLTIIYSACSGLVTSLIGLVANLEFQTTYLT